MGTNLNYKQVNVDHRLALAFNAGSDARLAGLEVGCNPYTSGLCDDLVVQAWVDGWHHADLHWGDGVRQRWAFLRLEAYTSRAAILALA